MPRRIQSAGIVVIVPFSIPQPSALSTEHFRRERQLDISALLARPDFLGGPGSSLAYQPTRALKDTLDGQDIGPLQNLCTEVFTEAGVLPADCWPTNSNARLGKLRYYPAARMCVPVQCCHSPGSSIDVPGGGSGVEQEYPLLAVPLELSSILRKCACASLGFSFIFSPNLYTKADTYIHIWAPYIGDYVLDALFTCLNRKMGSRAEIALRKIEEQDYAVQRWTWRVLEIDC